MSKQLLQQLVDINNKVQEQQDGQIGNIQVSQFDSTCREFLERGKILESIIQTVFDKFIPNLKRDLEQQKVCHPFQYVPIYSIIDVRGLRHFERYLPSDVILLEPLVHTLHNVCEQHVKETNRDLSLQRQMPSVNQLRSLTNMQSGFIGTNSQNQEAKSLFSTKYVLFVLLGRLVQCPFNWDDMDTNGNLTQLILQSCQIFINASSKLTSISNEVLGRFLSRKDQANLRQDIVEQINIYLNDKINQNVKINMRNASEIAGNVQLLSFISRFGVSVGSRIEVFNKPFQQLQWLLESKNREIIKISVVLASRCAQSYLTKQYQRSNVQDSDLLKELEGFSVPEEFDLFIDALLQLLGDSDPFVRSTAAFGLSNTLLYLPNLFTDEILEVLLDYCGPANTADEWAGALLALSNAIRLRLLLPKRISDLGSIIVNGLSNNFSKQSSMVKDAACFCIWSLARAYKVQEIELETIHNIAAAAAATAVTEREISARRSSAAAFQELAGRFKSPAIPSAIRCASILDYYELGDGKYCHLVLGPKLAAEDEIYRTRIMRNIMDRGLDGLQWAQRSQMAQLLASISSSAVDTWIVPELLQLLERQDDWSLWCGAAQALTQILLNEHQKAKDGQNPQQQSILSAQLREQLNVLMENCLKRQVDPSAPDGLHQIIQAVCGLVSAMVQADISDLNYDTIYQYLSKYVQVSVRHYLKDIAIQNYDRLFENTVLQVLQYLWQGKDLNPKTLTMDKLSQVACVSCISLATENGSFTVQENLKMKKLGLILLEYLEQHRSAADNVSRLFILRCIQNNVQYLRFEENCMIQFLKILQFCAQDYSIDNRGEVGMVVRHLCLHVLQKLFQKVNSDQNIAKIKTTEQYRLLAATYHTLIARFCCSKVETLRMLGIETMSHEYKSGTLQVCKTGKSILNSIYEIIMKQNVNDEKQNKVNGDGEQDINDKFCDLNDLTQEQQRKQLEQYNFEVLQRSYDVIQNVFVADPRFKKIAITCLIQNITFASQDDLDYTIKILKSQKSDELYTIILQNLEKITNKGLEGALQYACLQIINYLLYYEVEPPENCIMRLIEKASQYIQQTQINFHSFAVSFSIFEYFIVTSKDIQITDFCYKAILSYLTDPTAKVRENAADALRCCAIHMGKDIIELCVDDWINLSENEVMTRREAVARLFGVEGLIQ